MNKKQKEEFYKLQDNFINPGKSSETFELTFNEDFKPNEELLSEESTAPHQKFTLKDLEEFLETLMNNKQNKSKKIKFLISIEEEFNEFGHVTKHVKRYEEFDSIEDAKKHFNIDRRDI